MRERSLLACGTMRRPWRITHPLLRGANGSRECAPDDRLRDEAIHTFFCGANGLLRYARNDEEFAALRVRLAPQSSSNSSSSLTFSFALCRDEMTFLPP